MNDVGPRDAQALVLVSGWPQSMHCWRHVQPLLAKRGLRTIAIDPPGLGASDLLDVGASYTTPAVARHLAGAVDGLGLGSYVLVGHDIGAWISFAWAAAEPAGISKLVLLDAAIPGAMTSPGFSLEAAPIIFQFYFNAVPDLPEKLTRGRERTYLEWLFAAKVRRQDAITSADLDEYLRWYGQADRMSAGFEYYRAVPASIAALGADTRIDIPTLGLGGEFAYGANMAANLAAHCSNLEGGVVLGSGHFIPEEAPEGLADVIATFALAQQPIAVAAAVS